MVTKHYVVWYVLIFAISLFGAAVSLGIGGRANATAIIVAVVVAAVVPLPLMWIARKLGYPVGQAVSCPSCKSELPLFRKPRSLRQAMWGGYSCPTCAAELDARGRLRASG